MSGEQGGEAQLRPRARLAPQAVPTAGGLQLQVLIQALFWICETAGCATRRPTRRKGCASLSTAAVATGGGNEGGTTMEAEASLTELAAKGVAAMGLQPAMVEVAEASSSQLHLLPGARQHALSVGLSCRSATSSYSLRAAMGPSTLNAFAHASLLDGIHYFN